MAWLGSHISADEEDGYDKDCPMLIGKNQLSASNVSHKSFDPTSATVTTASDRSDEFTPIERIYDGHLDLPCRLSQHHAYTLTLDYQMLALKITGGIGFDTVILTGHNLASGRFSELGVRISDHDDLNAVGAVNILLDGAAYVDTEDFTTDARYVATKLQFSGSAGPKFIDNVQRLAVTFTQDSGEKVSPQLGELVLGKRRQLQHHPEFSWNSDDYVSNVSDIETADGNITRYALNSGQAVRTATLTLTGAAEIAAVEAWWEDCNHGQDPFWWIETPKTNPRAHYMRVSSPQLDFPQSVGAGARTLTLNMIEQRPFLAWEEDMY